MNYEHSVPFRGDSETALTMARTILSGLNFRLEHVRERSLEATGPGMNSSKENPINGASRLTLTVSESELNLEADLGGIRKMRLFLMVFPLGLGLFLAIIFAITLPQAGMIPIYATLGSLAPWIVLGPMLTKWMRKRTEKALVTFLVNVSQCAT